jgi:hypothetical protein
MHLEGIGLRTIGRILGVSNVTVLNWIKKPSQAQESRVPQRKSVREMRVDDLCGYMIRRSLEQDSSWLVTEIPDKSRQLSILIDSVPSGSGS